MFSCKSLINSCKASIITVYLLKLCKSMDWFLYDRDLRHKRVKHTSNETRNELTIYVGKLQYFTEKSRNNLSTRANFFISSAS